VAVSPIHCAPASIHWVDVVATATVAGVVVAVAAVNAATRADLLIRCAPHSVGFAEHPY
jgi:hypothetical protein